jgi:hypothetical protein
VTTERQVRAFVRRRRREHDPRRPSDRLIDIYTWFLATVIAAIVISPLVQGELVPHPGAFVDTLDWLPLVLLAAMWGVLRYGTWQGPVLFTTPELQWEVSSPLNRRALTLMKLRRASIIAAGIGIAGGAIVTIGAMAMLRRNLLGLAVACIGAFVALALLATALSWHVERSRSWTRVVDLATPAALVLIALVGASVARGLEATALWSGPWGWATGPVLAASGRAVSGWIALAGLLGVAATAAVVSAIATADQISEEELWRRSEARSSASAALFFGDVRAAKIVARRGRARGGFRGRELMMIRAPRPWLVIISRDVLTFRRNPGLVGVAASFVAAAVLSGVAARERPILAAGVFVGLYAAASRLSEPIRLENDRPDAHRMLPWPLGTVLLMHSVVPAIIIAVLVWIGLAVVGVGGYVAPPIVASLGVVTPFVAGTLVLSAGISASRRAFPVEMLITGAEMGSLAVVTWLVTGPTLALIAVGVAAGALLPRLDQGLTSATVPAIGYLVVAMVVFGTWLSTRKPRVA